MSVPAELMDVIAGGAGKGAAPGPNPAAAAAGGNQPPAGGPMSTPQPKEGLSQAAMVNISAVFKLLEQSLPAFGAQSEQGKAVIKMLNIANQAFGEQRQKSDALVPAELLQLLQSIPGVGGGSPVDKSMAGMPATKPAMPGVQ